jgi:hypothetical protein
MRPSNSARLSMEELNLRLTPSTLSLVSGAITYTAGRGK